MSERRSSRQIAITPMTTRIAIRSGQPITTAIENSTAVTTIIRISSTPAGLSAFCGPLKHRVLDPSSGASTRSTFCFSLESYPLESSLALTEIPRSKRALLRPS